MESAAPQRQGKSRQQLEDELLSEVEAAKKQYDSCTTEESRGTARENYELALHRLNDLVVFRKVPDEQ